MLDFWRRIDYDGTTNVKEELMFALGLLILGVISRLIVHLPNFTPVIALALFGGVYLKKKQAVMLPVILMAATDVFLGLHATILFTWGSLALIATIGLWARNRKDFSTLAAASLVSAVLFHVVTNFGVWLVSGMYPQTWAGLAACYTAAIPFFRHMLLSTALYALVLFGAYEAAVARMKKINLAHIVL